MHRNKQIDNQLLSAVAMSDGGITKNRPLIFDIFRRFHPTHQYRLLAKEWLFYLAPKSNSVSTVYYFAKTLKYMRSTCIVANIPRNYVSLPEDSSNTLIASAPPSAWLTNSETNQEEHQPKIRFTTSKTQSWCGMLLLYWPYEFGTPSLSLSHTHTHTHTLNQTRKDKITHPYVRQGTYESHLH